MARLTTYSDKVLKDCQNYLENWKEIGDNLPSVVGMCIYANVSKSSVYNWVKDAANSGLLDTLEAVKEIQEHTAINKGISGEFNSTITKLVLANHGYHEKKEIEHAGKIETPTAITFVGVGDDDE